MKLDLKENSMFTYVKVRSKTKKDAIAKLPMIKINILPPQKIVQ